MLTLGKSPAWRRVLRVRGFSLIEMMVVVAIMGILMAIAAPSLRDWTLQSQIKGKADAILNGLQLARSEALRRNARVAFTISADSSWTIGCSTVVTADADGDGVADCPATIQSKPSSEGGTGLSLTIAGGTGIATFSGVGTTVANADGSATLSQVTVSHPASARNMIVTLTAGGQSRICDSTVTTVGDPYKC